MTQMNTTCPDPSGNKKKGTLIKQICTGLCNSYEFV